MCSATRQADGTSMTCDHTFVVQDSAGSHIGCCYEYARDSFVPAIYFAECAR